MTTAETGDAPVAPWIGDDRTFGARLALVRQRMGWGNVKEAALRCGVPVESWRTWERDGVMPQAGRYFALCAQIATVAGCDYGWLVDRRPSQSTKPTSEKHRRKFAAVRGFGTEPSGNRPLLLSVR